MQNINAPVKDFLRILKIQELKCQGMNIDNTFNFSFRNQNKDKLSKLDSQTIHSLVQMEAEVKKGLALKDDLDKMIAQVRAILT